MSDELNVQEKSIDPAVQQMISKADKNGIVTVWDRYEAMTP